MAYCNLAVEIDDPKRVRTGGETITGTVVVTADSDLNCKGLDVTCCWLTHGRGNVARGDVEVQNLYQGEWRAGQAYRYPFKLKTADWPPTYYGNYLNVSHYVEARAKLPWKLDPKTLAEFTLVATESPADLTPTQLPKTKMYSGGWVVFALILGLGLFIALPIVLFLLAILSLFGGLFWGIFVFLPRQITGPVELLIEPKAIMAGQTLKGRFEFTPKLTTKINGISWTIRCVEKCSSGSGTSRTTHTQEVLSKVITLMEEGQLVAGKKQTYELQFTVPGTAPPSLKFTDNEVTWTSEMRIDIPRWPDWVGASPFVVKVPSEGMSATGESGLNADRMLESVAGPFTANVLSPQDDDDPWFTEVLEQILHAETDEERLSKVLEAVAGQEFSLLVDTQGEVDEPFDSNMDEDTLWLAAVDKARNVRMVLSIPQGVDIETLLWCNGLQATATIHGLDREAGRVMMQVIAVGPKS